MRRERSKDAPIGRQLYSTTNRPTILPMLSRFLEAAHRWGIVLVALAMSTGSARADDVVIESYVGARPAEATELLAPVLEELGSRSYLTAAALTRRIEERISRSGRPLSEAELTEADERIKTGKRAFLRGQFDQAIADAERVRALLMGASAHMARAQEVRDSYRTALIVLAESHRQAGDGPAATRAMAEMVRSFPNRPVSTVEYSPDVVNFFRQTKDDLDKLGVGTLSVEVDDESVAIFINESYAGGGSTTKTLYPGRYRVYVQRGDRRPGRIHEVEVNSGTTATLTVSWQVDSALGTAASVAELVFRDEATRQAAEVATVTGLARVLGGKNVVVVGIRAHNEHRSIVGVVLSVETGREVRSAVLALEPVRPSDEKLRRLARFLAGDESVGGFTPVAEAESPDALDPTVADSTGDALGPASPYRTWKWVALASGVGAMAGGAVLVAIHLAPNDGTGQNEFVRDTRTTGVITLAVGAVLTGVGGYLWLRDRPDAREERTTRLLLEPTAGGAIVGVGGRF